jgi:hypothetical protein
VGVVWCLYLYNGVRVALLLSYNVPHCLGKAALNAHKQRISSLASDIAKRWHIASLRCRACIRCCAASASLPLFL